MSNVIRLVAAVGSPRTPSASEIQAALSQAAELLQATAQSILDSDGDMNPCHRITVEKVENLLSLASDGTDHDVCGVALDALGLVSLARFAMDAGKAAFDKGTCRKADYGYSIVRALEAAAGYLG